MLRLIAACCLVFVACYSQADEPATEVPATEAPATEEPIEITFDDLQTGGISEREKLPERVTSIQGNLVRIVGWGQSPGEEGSIWMRPGPYQPNWLAPFNEWVTVHPHEETTLPPPDSQIEVTGIFTSEQVRYRDRVGFAHHIKDARIRVIESIEVSYDDLRWNGNLGMIPKRVAEIEGKHVWIFGWCDGSSPHDEDYPIVDLRPDITIADSPELRFDWIKIKPKSPRRVRSGSEVDVRGVFIFRDGHYHIDDAVITVFRHPKE